MPFPALNGGILQETDAWFYHFCYTIPAMIETAVLLLLTLLCTRLLLLAAPSRELSFPDALAVERAVLANGLTVLVHTDTSHPVACLYGFVRVGSSDDPPGKSGLSHLLEHLMFQGSRRFPADRFDRILEESGGESNACTSHDFTIYDDTFAPDALETVVDMEADRFAHLDLLADQLESERKVILEERHLDLEDSPYGRMLEALYETAFTGHSYAWPVMGRREEIRAIRLDDCVRHYRRYYTPANTTLVLAGDLQPDAALRTVDRYFGSIPSGSTIAREEPAPIAHREAETRVALTMDTETPGILMGYPIPALGHDDAVALDAIADILGSGRSGRIYRELVEGSAQVLDYEVDVDELLQPGLFGVYLQPREGRDLGELDAAFRDVVDRLVEHGATEAELRKFRNGVLADHLRSMKTVAGRAELLGYHETMFGDYRTLFDVPEHYAGLRPEDIAPCAARYLQASDRTVVELRGTRPPAEDGT